MAHHQMKIRSQEKLMDAAQLIKFDLTSPEYVIFEGDLLSFGGGDQVKAARGATKFLMQRLVDLKYQTGINRTEGKIWAGWLEVLEGNDQIVTVPKSQLVWIRDIAVSEDLRVPPAMAQWRESLIDAINEALAPKQDPQEQS